MAAGVVVGVRRAVTVTPSAKISAQQIEQTPGALVGTAHRVQATQLHGLLLALATEHWGNT